MNGRERYLAAILFEKPDRIPFQPGKPREITLTTWRQQGLPEGADWFQCLCKQMEKMLAGVVPDRVHINEDMAYKQKPIR
ncbi:MAG: hypothetical protein HY360_08085 [Verrucomicrobia bacterium]|nr:hypothetical protein [Verrucomicrobiota bacterium]